MNLAEDFLDALKKQGQEISDIVKKLSETDYVSDEKSFRCFSERLQILSEKYTYSVREFCINTFVTEKCKVYENAAEVQEIKIRKEGKIIIIDFPFLMPRKKAKEVNYIGEPLKYQFEKICENENLKIKEKAVICIIHIYDNVNRKAKCYDYDNLETKRVLDIITLYTLTDDSPKYCDVYHTVEFSNTNRTRIIVMPSEEF